MLGSRTHSEVSEDDDHAGGWGVFKELVLRRFLLSAGASGDLAYTVGYEHSSASRNGGPVTPNTLRVTHVFRRENGEW